MIEFLIILFLKEELSEEGVKFFDYTLNESDTFEIEATKSYSTIIFIKVEGFSCNIYSSDESIENYTDASELNGIDFGAFTGKIIFVAKTRARLRLTTCVFPSHCYYNRYIIMTSSKNLTFTDQTDPSISTSVSSCFFFANTDVINTTLAMNSGEDGSSLIYYQSNQTEEYNGSLQKTLSAEGPVMFAYDYKGPYFLKYVQLLVYSNTDYRIDEFFGYTESVQVTLLKTSYLSYQDSAWYRFMIPLLLMASASMTCFFMLVCHSIYSYSRYGKEKKNEEPDLTSYLVANDKIPQPLFE